ncbi:MAG: ferritin family protein [Planctomycetota bacterium]
MNTKEKQIDTIEILAKHELAISQLYMACAERFPAYKDFWRELSEEETEHARWINELHSKVEDGRVYFNENRFQTAAIARSLQYIQELQQKVPQPDFSLINALSAAVAIEDALIENKYFEAFEADSPALKEVLRILAEATDKHRTRIHKAKSENK